MSADFGLSEALNNFDDTTDTVVSTKITIVPEIFHGKQNSSKTDI